jgi:protoheme IX farnesyltransferase
MKTAVPVEPEIAPLVALEPPAPPAAPAAEPASRATAAAPSRLTDYLELTKPRIAVMALFTVAIGYLLGAGPDAQALALLHTLLGAGLVAAGGSALNQFLERKSDARMRRTANRPLPAGRLHPAEAFAFGVVLAVAGVVYLALTVPLPAVIAAALTGFLYVAVYTPLKRVTVWNTVVGAVPGALPPVIGWCAARGWDAPAGAASLFLVLFLWQLPHFLAIAWMYRADYERGGMRMLPIADPTGDRTAAAMVVTAALLVPAGLWPTLAGIAGAAYTAGAAVLGVMFAVQAMLFRECRTDRNARKVLRASLLYLPGVLGLLLLDGLLVRLVG